MAAQMRDRPKMLAETGEAKLSSNIEHPLEGSAPRERLLDADRLEAADLYDFSAEGERCPACIRR